MQKALYNKGTDKSEYVYILGYGPAIWFVNEKGELHNDYPDRFKIEDYNKLNELKWDNERRNADW